jgi:hypothetical protein
MADKLKRDKGKGIYKKRKETVEPVFGIIGEDAAHYLGSILPHHRAYGSVHGGSMD